MKIAIFEDCKKDIEVLVRIIQNFFNSKDIKISVYICKSKDYLIEKISLYDIIFLDIELGNENGIDIGLDLLKYKRDCRIIITSSYVKYLMDGYKIDADRYFIKPITQKEFNIEMNPVVTKYFNEYLGFTDKKICREKIYYKNILYVEYFDRKTLIHLINNKVLESSYTLKYWISKFEESTFSQPHKAFVINLKYVSGFTKRDIILMNNELIPYSRHYKKSFEQEYLSYLHTTL